MNKEIRNSHNDGRKQAQLGDKTMQKHCRKLSPRMPKSGRVAFGLTVLAGLMAQAYAQEAAPKADLGQVVVHGYQASLESSTRDKREAVGFQDSIFAEDMGKFPDSNIAESLARIPGVTVNREITGEGQSIAIRGLGSSFTRVLMNGAPVAVTVGNGQSTNAQLEDCAGAAIGLQLLAGPPNFLLQLRELAV